MSLCLRSLRRLKKAAGGRPLPSAVLFLLRRGLRQAEEEAVLHELRTKFAELQQEHLKLARLIHEYESKIGSLERRTYECEEEKRRLELGFVGVAKENRWMKEELLRRNRERRSDLR